jgi:hypothetical protein
MPDFMVLTLKYDAADADRKREAAVYRVRRR